MKKMSDMKPVSLRQYADALGKNNYRIFPAGPERFWVQYEALGYVRVPTFDLDPVLAKQVTGMLWQGWGAVASFILPPDKHHEPNAWLFICRDAHYNLEKLSKNARRDARRAERYLQIEPLEWKTLFDYGLSAYSDTRIRVGLTDGTPDRFKKRFGAFSKNPAHHVLGAWKDDKLAAFMTLVTVDDWVEIEGCFSTNEHRGFCPNDGLGNYVLEHFLAQQKARIVSYGLSSVQEGSGHDGLHAYKTKVGFEAIPVHRAFVFHPFVRPFVNRLTYRGVRLIQSLLPGVRRINKLGGILANAFQREHLEFAPCKATQSASEQKQLLP